MILLTQTSASCALVEAVRFQPKNAHKTVHISYPFDYHDFKFMYFHLVFRLTLPSGLKFAFDPTGAQNGWQEALAPWDAYEENRVHFIMDIRKINECDLRLNMDSNQLVNLASIAFRDSVRGCLGLELTEGGREKLLHRLSDTDFETTKDSLVKAFGRTFTFCRSLFY